MEYVKDKLVSQLRDGKMDKVIIVGTIQDLTLDNYLQESGTKKERKKPQVTDNGVADKFNEFWAVWPSTKSIPGTRFRSGKSMKSDAEKMRYKFADIVRSGEVTADQLIHASRVYLELNKQDSIRNDRNEYEHINGMEPWLNQKKYLNYLDMELEDEYEPNNNCA